MNIKLFYEIYFSLNSFDQPISMFHVHNVIVCFSDLFWFHFVKKQSDWAWFYRT